MAKKVSENINPGITLKTFFLDGVEPDRACHPRRPLAMTSSSLQSTSRKDTPGLESRPAVAKRMGTVVRQRSGPGYADPKENGRELSVTEPCCLPEACGCLWNGFQWSTPGCHGETGSIV